MLTTCCTALTILNSRCHVLTISILNVLTISTLTYGENPLTIISKNPLTIIITSQKYAEDVLSG